MATPGAVCGHPDGRALAGHGTVRPERAVAQPNGGPEHDLAGHRIEREVAIGRTAGGEVRDLGPLLPAILAGHFDGQGRLGRDHWPVAQQVPLARHPLRRAYRLVGHQLRVDRGRGPADGERGQGPDLG